MGVILSFLTGGLAKYVVLGIVATGLLTWFVHDLRAPLKREISALHAASEKKEAISEADTIRADVAEAELAKTQAQLESLLHDQKPVCRLSGAELDGLRRVAAGSTGRR
jgi:hypothetical protein